MEISDLTKSLLEGHQIIIVEFSDGKCLTFLVADEGKENGARTIGAKFKVTPAIIPNLPMEPKNKGAIR